MKSVFILRLLILANIIFGVSAIQAHEYKKGSFSNWSISRGCHNYIISVLQPGQT